MAIPERCLLEALAAYDGWSYAPVVDGQRDCRYPIHVADYLCGPPPTQTDCVTFVEGVVLGAATLANIIYSWPKWRHDKAMMSQARHAGALARARAGDYTGLDLLFGLPSALAEAGLADLHDGGEWTVLQGWSRDFRSGHSVLVGPRRNGGFEVWEASRSAGRVRRTLSDAPWRRWPYVRAARLSVD